jgi:preprotein translocase subunit Sss1
MKEKMDKYRERKEELKKLEQVMKKEKKCKWRDHLF